MPNPAESNISSPADFKNQLRRLCAAQPMRLDHYMAVCLSDENWGYYQIKDRFGTMGDFTTAPEISQLFGEIITAWLIWQWQQKGCSDAILAEAGPGRGSLMRDILVHARKICPEFLAKTEIHLIETSPAYQQIQKQHLHDYQVTWHRHITTLPKKFMMLLGNEFLDALPTRQLHRQDNFWAETYISCDDEQSDLTFCKIKTAIPSDLLPLEHQLSPQNGQWLEYSPLAMNFCDDAARHISEYGGFALLIDYGGTNALRREPSLEAIAKHRHIDPLAAPSETDLTLHVNFSLLDYVFQSYHLPVEFSTQKTFLCQFGILERMQSLCKQNLAASERISQAGNRLIAEDEMGELFKFMAVNIC